MTGSGRSRSNRRCRPRRIRCAWRARSRPLHALGCKCFHLDVADGDYERHRALRPPRAPLRRHLSTFTWQRNCERARGGDAWRGQRDGRRRRTGRRRAAVARGRPRARAPVRRLFPPMIGPGAVAPRSALVDLVSLEIDDSASVARADRQASPVACFRDASRCGYLQGRRWAQRPGAPRRGRPNVIVVGHSRSSSAKTFPAPTGAWCTRSRERAVPTPAFCDRALALVRAAPGRGAYPKPTVGAVVVVTARSWARA